MTKKLELNALKLGYAGAITSAVIMLLLGVLPNFGLYNGATQMMMNWHMFFSPTPIGIVTGMLEAAVLSFVFLYAFAWIYNKA